MKKTFQKTLIAAAAGVAMMSAMGSASANSLLFPYFTTLAGTSSILSLSMGTTGGATIAAGEVLHYVYNYGSACTHYDGNGKMTANDLMQHSVAAPTATAGGFGNVIAGDKSLPFYFPLKDNGFLTVSTKTSATAKISGEMIIWDPANGLAVSLPGWTNDGVLGAGVAVDTTDAGGQEGNFSFVNNNFNLSAYPTSMVQTSWYAVALGNMNPAIVARSDWTGRVVFSNNGVVYDNDEVPYSGMMQPPVRCFATLAPFVAGSPERSFMTTAQNAAIGTASGLLIHAHHVNGNRAGTSGDRDGTGVFMAKMQVVTTTSPKVGMMHVEQFNAY